jgi:hypothetical protein
MLLPEDVRYYHACLPLQLLYIQLKHAHIYTHTVTPHLKQIAHHTTSRRSRRSAEQFKQTLYTEQQNKQQNETISPVVVAGSSCACCRCRRRSYLHRRPLRHVHAAAGGRRRAHVRGMISATRPYMHACTRIIYTCSGTI